MSCSISYLLSLSASSSILAHVCALIEKYQDDADSLLSLLLDSCPPTLPLTNPVLPSYEVFTSQALNYLIQFSEHSTKDQPFESYVQAVRLRWFAAIENSGSIWIPVLLQLYSNSHSLSVHKKIAQLLITLVDINPVAQTHMTSFFQTGLKNSDATKVCFVCSFDNVLECWNCKLNSCTCGTSCS